ncbi:MAG: hypothetical protein JO352_37050 [Chloroflexi bacterium]|nr:hypothetical protein [Chloroflexota bacterium]MBV9598088.1 hypothetical protein [Chloroflexota bacterium]
MEISLAAIFDRRADREDAVGASPHVHFHLAGRKVSQALWTVNMGVDCSESEYASSAWRISSPATCILLLATSRIGNVHAQTRLAALGHFSSPLLAASSSWWGSTKETYFAAVNLLPLSELT